MDDLEKLLENAGIRGHLGGPNMGVKQYKEAERNEFDDEWSLTSGGKPAINPATGKPYTRQEWEDGKKPHVPVEEVIAPDQEGYGDMDELLEELSELLDYRTIDKNVLEGIINKYSDMRQPDEFDPYDTDDVGDEVSRNKSGGTQTFNTPLKRQSGT